MSYQEQTTKEQGTGYKKELATQNLAVTLEGLGNCSRLLAAVREAELDHLLRGAEWITVFAPADDVLDSTSGAEAGDLAGAHLARGRLRTDDIRQTPEVRTIDGQKHRARLENGRLWIDEAEVVRADVHCNNGIIHLVSKPLAVASRSPEELTSA